MTIANEIKMKIARLKVLLSSVALVLLATLASSVNPAHAEFGAASVGGSATDGRGNALTQAGAHPDVMTLITFNRKSSPFGELTDGTLKTSRVDLPPGLIANPTATPKCPQEALELAQDDIPRECDDAIVGRARVYNLAVNIETQPLEGFPVPLYSMVPPAGVAARLSFKIYGVVSNIDARVRSSSPVGVTATASNVPQAIPIFGVRVTLWGVPQDPIHDAERFGPTTAARKAFVTSPTSCPAEPFLTRVSLASWENPDEFKVSSFDHDFDGFPLRADGCGKLKFTPAASVVPTSKQPDAPTGLDIGIENPSNIEIPDGFANAHLKDVTVQLPEGLTINPGSADGLQACTDAQLRLEEEAPETCPDAAKIGTAVVDTPLLDEDVKGSLFIRSQNSSDPESGEMFRVALVLRNDERGVLVKLAGQVRANKDTGRLTATFKDNPQLPVDSIEVQMKSGPRAPLATSATCGSTSVATDFTSWAGHAVNVSNPVDVACTPGLGGFAPAFTAGAVAPRAGGFSPFTVGITKPDGNAAIDGLTMKLPVGLVAQLKGNVGTQVGKVTAFAGPGTNPFALPGQVYLEGPYGDAPFSLKVVVPAKAGPFDLGEVVVRQKIYVDPITAQVTVVSDPIPTIVKGVPARLQRLDVNVDKPGFVINPTSCAEKAVEGALKSVAGQTAALSVRFQVGECSSLDLKPSLALSLSGKGQTTDGKHPAVTANLTQSAGQSNLKKVRVALPLSLALDPDNANGLCEFADGSKATPTCPKASIVGTATAVTPILDEPLSGPVYFVKNIRKDAKSGREIRTLPKLVIPLVGQNGLKLTLTGTSNVEDDQLVTTFDNIPDAPVSSFKLNINGGKGGILTVSDADICKSTQVAEQQIDGQNNKQADADVYIQTPSCALKVLSKKITKRSVTLKVSGLGAGKVTVTGKGIKKTSKSINKSTVATIVVKRIKGAPKQIKVSFLAQGAKKATTATA
jgi:hypothetical protein